MEKFFNIKCRASGLKPKCAVIVATIRALKMHGGGPVVKAGQPLAREYKEENMDLLQNGVANLVKHIENANKFGVNVVVAVNRFSTDTEKEIEAVITMSKQAGAFDAVMSNHWALGGKGAADLARAVEKECKTCDDSNFKFLYGKLFLNGGMRMGCVFISLGDYMQIEVYACVGGTIPKNNNWTLQR